MENKLNLPLKKKKNEAESPRLDPLMRALKALHSAGAPETMTEEELEHQRRSQGIRTDEKIFAPAFQLFPL